MNRMFVVLVPEILLTILSTQNCLFVFLTETVVLLEDISHSFARDSLLIYYSCMVGHSKICGSQKKEKVKALPLGQTF